MLIAKSLRLVGHLDLDEKNSTRTWEDKTGGGSRRAAAAHGHGRHGQTRAPSVKLRPRTPVTWPASALGPWGSWPTVPLSLHRCRPPRHPRRKLPCRGCLTVCQTAHPAPSIPWKVRRESVLGTARKATTKPRASCLSIFSIYTTYRPCPAGRTSCRLGARARFPFLFPSRAANLESDGGAGEGRGGGPAGQGRTMCCGGDGECRPLGWLLGLPFALLAVLVSFVGAVIWIIGCVVSFLFDLAPLYFLLLPSPVKVSRLTDSFSPFGPCIQAAHLVHLPLLPLRDGAAGGGRGARQGAAPCHDLVHLQDPLLAVPCFLLCGSYIHLALAGEVAVLYCTVVSFRRRLVRSS